MTPGLTQSISTRFAFRVYDLNRQGLSVTAIARNLNASEMEVMDVHHLLYLPVIDAEELLTMPTEVERAVAIERMPKGMQDWIRRSRS